MGFQRSLGRSRIYFAIAISLSHLSCKETGEISRGASDIGIVPLPPEVHDFEVVSPPVPVEAYRKEIQVQREVILEQRDRVEAIEADLKVIQAQLKRRRDQHLKKLSEIAEKKGWASCEPAASPKDGHEARRWRRWCKESGK